MVKFIDNELLSIKKEILDMWDLVYNQLSRANQAMTTMNTDIANKIMVQEKLVNSYDLKIDSLIEDFIALYTPVAVDLRFVLAMLNINNNLERIGDYAESIARFVIRRNRETIERPLLEALRLDEMFEHVLFMVETAKRAMKEENMPWAQAWAGKPEAMNAASRSYNITTIPRLLLISPEGKVIFSTHDAEALRFTIERLIK